MDNLTIRLQELKNKSHSLQDTSSQILLKSKRLKTQSDQLIEKGHYLQYFIEPRLQKIRAQRLARQMREQAERLRMLQAKIALCVNLEGMKYFN